MSGMEAGWIYALTTPSLPGVCKIGRTTRDPVTRARELGGYAGATADYVVVAHAAVPDAVASETQAHRMLRHCRRKGKEKELFDVTPGRARAVIFAVARSGGPARHLPQSRRFGRRFTRRRWNRTRMRLAGMLILSAALLAARYFL